MSELDRLFNPSQQSLREQLSRTWTPSQEEIALIMEHNFYPYEQEGTRKVYETPYSLVSDLTTFRNEVFRVTGEIPSRREICAQLVLRGTAIPAREFAILQYNARVFDAFRFWYDISSGQLIIVNSIFTGEEGVEDPSNKVNPQREKFAQQVARLLEEDPSGFLLIDTALHSMETDPDAIPEYQVREFTLAGAKLAAKLYKLSYPLSENLPPPPSPR